MRSVERHYVKKKQCHLARCSRKSSICEKKVPDRAAYNPVGGNHVK